VAEDPYFPVEGFGTVRAQLGLTTRPYKDIDTTVAAQVDTILIALRAFGRGRAGVYWPHCMIAACRVVAAWMFRLGPMGRCAHCPDGFHPALEHRGDNSDHMGFAPWLGGRTGQAWIGLVWIGQPPVPRIRFF